MAFKVTPSRKLDDAEFSANTVGLADKFVPGGLGFVGGQGVNLSNSGSSGGGGPANHPGM